MVASRAGSLASLDRSLPPSSLTSLPCPSPIHGFSHSNRSFRPITTAPNSDKARLLIEHFEANSRHLQIACLALQLSDCSDHGWVRDTTVAAGCLRSLPAAASLVGLLCSLNGAALKNRRPYKHVRFLESRSLRRKDCAFLVACQCSGDFRSSENGAAEDGFNPGANDYQNSIRKSSTGSEVDAARILPEPESATPSSRKGGRSTIIYDPDGERTQNRLSGTRGRQEDGDGNGNLYEKSTKIEDESPDSQLDKDQGRTLTSQRRWTDSMPTDGTRSTYYESDSTTQRTDLDGPRFDNTIPERWDAGNDQAKRSGSPTFSSNSSVESVSSAVKEPFYEVLEVNSGGIAVTKSVSRRQLLKSSGLRLRDVRSVDPSLWVTNSVPALLTRDEAILLNLGSLRAIATPESVLIFDHKSIGAQGFLELLLPRLNAETSTGVPTMPFELEVVEAALLSRTQRLERRLMEVEPRVLSLLEVLPNRLTANVLEELRLSKQALVELGSKAGALRQMLLELLESPQEIRRMTIMGRGCIIKKDDGSIECAGSADKQSADDEEEEMEMLLENYLQRCESCHGQAERLLDSAKEMEDSIAVSLSSRRLEVSRLELLLQVGTFCSALGALVAGIFGMNLKSYLEESAIAFLLTTAGIILGGIILFFIMYNHLKQRKIL